MNRILAAAASVALLLCAARAGADEPAKADLAKGKQVAGQVCVACHAADGNSVIPTNPKLAGQISQYLYKQLRDFKAAQGEPARRPSPIMAGITASLSDGDMRDLAAYFASQTLQPAAAHDKNLAAEGQTLYRGGDRATAVPACAGCHAPTGAGIPVEFPRLGGQFAEYVEAQLKAFKSGERANDPNAMMRDIAARLSEQQIRALAQYVAGLR